MSDVMVLPPPPPPEAPPASPPASRSRRVITILALIAAAVLAAASGSSLGDGTKAAVVLPLAAGVGLCLAWLAASRFAVYVMIMLAIRSSIDMTKLSGPTAGTTQQSGARALDPASIFAVLFIASSALWLATEFRRTGLRGTRLRLALLAMLGTCGASVIASGNPKSSAMEWLRIAAVVTMFLILEQLASRPGGIRGILGAVYVSAVFPLMLTAASFAAGSPRTEHKGQIDRTIGTFNQSNEFGRYLMLLIIMGVAIYPTVERRWRPLLTVALGTSSIFLLLTYTRSAIVGTVVGLLIVGMIQNKRIVVGMLAVGALAMVIVPGVFTRFAVLDDSSARAGQGNSLAWRLDYWSEVLPLANKNPVTGIGLAQTQYMTDAAKQPHNDFLRAYVETGVVGLAAYLAMLAALIRLGRRAVRRTRKGTFERSVAAGFLGSAVAFIAVSTVANVISNVVVLWYFFAYAALASALARGVSARRLEPSPP